MFRPLLWRRKNSPVLLMKNSKHSFKNVAQLYLRSLMSNHSTHLAYRFLVPKWSYKSETLCHVMFLWLPQSLHYQFLPTLYHGFFNCFWCDDLNWASWTFNVTRNYATTMNYNDGSAFPFYSSGLFIRFFLVSSKKSFWKHDFFCYFHYRHNSKPINGVCSNFDLYSIDRWLLTDFSSSEEGNSKKSRTY